MERGEEDKKTFCLSWVVAYHRAERKKYKKQRTGINKRGQTTDVPFLPTSAALNQGQCCPLEGTWKCLAKFLLVVSGVG